MSRVVAGEEPDSGLGLPACGDEPSVVAKPAGNPIECVLALSEQHHAALSH